jgi:hypothetical protein
MSNIGEPVICTCPPGAWWGIYPPYCPAHHPYVHPIPFFKPLDTWLSNQSQPLPVRVPATRPEEV